MGDPMNYHYEDDKRKNFNAIEIVEVPGCLFNGVQVCLSTRKKSDLLHVKAMAACFRRWYNEQAHSGLVLPFSVGNPLRGN